MVRGGWICPDVTRRCLYGLEFISTCPIVSGRVQMRMCADVRGFGFVFETQSDVA